MHHLRVRVRVRVRGAARLRLRHLLAAAAVLCGALVASAPAQAVSLPGAPTMFLAEELPRGVVLFWHPSTEGASAITGFAVTGTDLTTGDPIAACPAAATLTAYGCAVTPLTPGHSYTFTVAAISPDGTGPATTLASPITAAPAPPNSPSAAQYRCDGAPGEPSSIPVTISQYYAFGGNRANRAGTVDVTVDPALPTGAGTFDVSLPFAAVDDGGTDIRNSVVYRSAVAGLVLDQQQVGGTGQIPNAPGATTHLGVWQFPDARFAVPPSESVRKLYGTYVRFNPAPGSPYCADVRFVTVSQWLTTSPPLYFVDDPRVVPAPPTAVVPGIESATVTVAPVPSPLAAKVASYTVTASPGGRTCTVAASATPRSCTVTGLDDGTRYAFRSQAFGPWGDSNDTRLPLLATGTPVDVQYDVLSDPSDASAAVSVHHRLPITITADDQTKQYGDADPPLTYSVTGLDPGDALTTAPSCTRAAGETPGTRTITCSGAAASDRYAVSYVDGALSVTRRPLVVTPAAQSIVDGEPLPAAYPYALTSGSVLDADTLTGTCGIDAPPTGPGSYPITCPSLTAGEGYELTVAPARLTVTAKAQPVATPTPEPAIETPLRSPVICRGPGVLLDALQRRGAQVAWSGRAPAFMVGNTVELRVEDRVIATAQIAADGRFAGTARRVPGDDVRYVAAVGAFRSAAVTNAAEVAARYAVARGRLTVTGRAPASRRAGLTAVLIGRPDPCGERMVERAVRLRADGRFEVTVKPSAPGLYRVLIKRGSTVVRSSAYQQVDG